MVDESFTKKLSGLEKTAIILLSVDEQHAAKVFSLMNEEEIKEISGAMSSLGVVRPEIVDQILTEFSNEMSNSVNFVGNIETTERLLEKFLEKDKVNHIMEEIRGPIGKNTWDKLSNVNDELLASYLKNEYPQTAAMIISKIHPTHASRVISSLPEEFAIEVMLRMLNIEPVKKEVLDRVERVLKAEFISTLTKTQKYNATEVMAEIFNNFDRNSETKFMSMLEQKVPESAVKIKELMFTFEDLVKVNQAGIQALLRVIDKAKLTIALKGASETIKNLFLNNMSQRAAKILREDLSALGPVRLKDVDEAQATIIATARDMASRDEIVIATEGDDEFID